MRLVDAADTDAGTGLSEETARAVDLAWSAGMVLLVGAVFALLSWLPGVAVPVLLAAAAAYALDPLVVALCRRGLGRVWATGAVFLVGALLLGAGLTYAVPLFGAEARKVPGFLERVGTQALPQLEAALGVSLPELVRERTAALGAEASGLLESAGPTAARLLAAFAGNTVGLLGTLLGLLVVPVLAFLFLADWPRLLARLLLLVPRRAAPLVARRFAEVDGVLSAFVKGQLMVGAILAALYAVGLSLAGVDLAVVIGVVAGFGNMVPYLGTALGVVLALLGAALAWQGPWQLAAVGLTFLVGQLLEGFVITPRIVGERVGLSSVAVILAILAFSELFGFTGILLAVPVTAVLKVVVRVGLHRYQRSRFYLEGAGAP